MIYTHDISPFLIQFTGTFGIRWYGIMYLIGFLIGYTFWKKYKDRFGFNDKQIEDLLLVAILGVIVGGRLGYILLYSTSIFWTNPLEIFALWHGGMSIHGGILGIFIGLLYFMKKYSKTFFSISDFIVIPASFALVFGRIGNFINGELWGFPTSGTWGVIFPHADSLPRHPSQLYASGLNLLLGLVLIFLWKKYPKSTGLLSCSFMMGYGLHRFIQETFWRVGDAYYYGLSLGQWYSIPLFLIGLIIFLSIRKSKS